MKAWKRAARQRASFFLPVLGGLPPARSLRFSASRCTHGRVADQRPPVHRVRSSQHSGPHPVLLPGAWPLSRGKTRGRAQTQEMRGNTPVGPGSCTKIGAGWKLLSRLRVCGSRHGHMTHDLSPAGPTGALLRCSQNCLFPSTLHDLQGGLVALRLPPPRL